MTAPAENQSGHAVNTADLYDERGEELASVALQFQSLGGRSHFSGPVRTIRCFQDNAPGQVHPGDPRQRRRAGGGRRRLPGHGPDGGHDRRECRRQRVGRRRHQRRHPGPRGDRRTADLGVKALGSNPRKSAKAGAGEVDVEMVIDGVTIRPGATIWCDPDGILVER